jgi:lysozyme
MAANPRVIAAVLAACALAVPGLAVYEGKVNKGYADPAPGAFPTICYGHMEPGVIGKTYDDQRCAELLAQDAVKHGLDIAKCLPDELPTETRAAFISFGFNVGSAKFCASTLAAKARAGDLRGACAELSRWTTAGGKTLPGLVKRRAGERALCERGLK